MANTQDTLCPEYVGEQRIVVNLADPLATRQAYTTIFLDIDYSGCDPQGVALPLELTISTELGTSFERQVFHRVVPSQVGFTPREGGDYTVRISEHAHNRWFGTLTFKVAGDRLKAEA